MTAIRDVFLILAGVWFVMLDKPVWAFVMFFFLLMSMVQVYSKR